MTHLAVQQELHDLPASVPLLFLHVKAAELNVSVSHQHRPVDSEEVRANYPPPPGSRCKLPCTMRGNGGGDR